MRSAARFGPLWLVALAVFFLALAVLACSFIPVPLNVETPHKLIWMGALRDGNYSVIITQASKDLAESPEDAEAYLFRGLAYLASGDRESARTDLEAAEARAAQFPPSWATDEQMLLYRGLMVLHAQLGNADAANRYLNQAIAVAPARESVIRAELQNQALSLDVLRP